MYNFSCWVKTRITCAIRVSAVSGYVYVRSIYKKLQWLDGFFFR